MCIHIGRILGGELNSGNDNMYPLENLRRYSAHCMMVYCDSRYRWINPHWLWQSSDCHDWSSVFSQASCISCRGGWNVGKGRQTWMYLHSLQTVEGPYADKLRYVPKTAYSISTTSCKVPEISNSYHLTPGAIYKLIIDTYFPFGSNSMQIQLAGWALIVWSGFKSGQLQQDNKVKNVGLCI